MRVGPRQQNGDHGAITVEQLDYLSQLRRSKRLTAHQDKSGLGRRQRIGGRPCGTTFSPEDGKARVLEEGRQPSTEIARPRLGKEIDIRTGKARCRVVTRLKRFLFPKRV